MSDIDERLDRMVEVLDRQTNLILAIDARIESGFAAVSERLDRIAESVVRGFTWRDAQVAELAARVRKLEERLPPEGEVRP